MSRDRDYGYFSKRLTRIPSWTANQVVHGSRLFYAALSMMARQRRQSLAEVEERRARYQRPFMGERPMMEILRMLSECYDPSDPSLGGVSQLMHSLQVVEAMEEAGIRDRDLLIAGLIHDAGKLLYNFGVPADDIVDGTAPLGNPAAGVGWDRCVFPWGHDEFLYERIKGHVPDAVSWLVRYHSVVLGDCQSFMDDRDRVYAERYLRPFQRFDQGSKSLFHVPSKRLEDHRSMVEDYFPGPILF